MLDQLKIISHKPAAAIDRVNDRLTSYRLMLYFLAILVAWGLIGSFYGNVPYSWRAILASGAWLLLICWVVNKLLSSFLKIPTNKESDLITALILTLILTPAASAHDFLLLAGAGAAAIASKFLITVHKSHIFNPAASGAFVAGELLHYYPSWWVGTKFMTPVVVAGGILVLRKTNRYAMVGVFLAVYLLYLIFGTDISTDSHLLWESLIATQVLFFAIVMLTEPLTSPTVARKYLTYAVLVSALYSITKLKITPEEALLIGNLFTFLASPNRRYELKFIRKLKEADGVYSYAFSMPPKFNFQAGQYMEWTLAENKTDSRGNRRYLTISSSPTEPGLMFTVKQPQPASAFKQRLNRLKPGETIIASRLTGKFVLPHDTEVKLAFLAGGVGITPFRSMVKYFIDANQPRDAVLVYSAASDDEIAFRDIFAKSGIRPEYVTGQHVDSAMIKKLIPDYKQRLFYISGPFAFVHAMEANLVRLGVSGGQIIKDFFPGYGG